MARPARKLGPWLATLLVAGNMVGSGVYLLPATLASVGGASVIGWGLAAGGALVLALVFALLTRLRPTVDGIVAWPRQALGAFIGFQGGLAYWLSCWIGCVAIALAATGYLAVFAPVLRSPWPAAAATVGLIWLVTLANLVGARFVGRLAGAALGIGLIPIAVAVVFGWARFDPAVFMGSWNVSGQPLTQAVPASLVLVFWAFLGLESAAVAAAVVRDPERDVPVAAVGGVLLASVVYIAATTAVMGVLPAEALARSTAPFADVASRLLGPAAGLIVAACALVKTVGTLAGWVLATAETSRAGAAQGLFPRALSTVHPDAVPARDLLLAAGLMSLATVLSVQPTLGAQFGVIVNVTTVLSLYVYALCCLALVRFSAAAAPGRRAVAVAAAAVGFAFCAWITAVSDLQLLAVAAGLLAAALPLWLTLRAARRA